jgi:hypothetical protein
LVNSIGEFKSKKQPAQVLTLSETLRSCVPPSRPVQSTFLYGSLLSQLAYQSVADLLGISPGSRAGDPNWARLPASIPLSAADSLLLKSHISTPNPPPPITPPPPLPVQSTFLYGSLLCQLAHQSVADLLGLSPGSRAVDPNSEAAAAVVAAAVAQLRQAAGVYDHLAKQMLPALLLTIKGDR